MRDLHRNLFCPVTSSLIWTPATKKGRPRASVFRQHPDQFLAQLLQLLRLKSSSRFLQYPNGFRHGSAQLLTARAIQHQARLGARCLLVPMLAEQSLVFRNTPLQILRALHNCLLNRHIFCARLPFLLGQPNKAAKKTLKSSRLP